MPEFSRLDPNLWNPNFASLTECCINMPEPFRTSNQSQGWESNDVSVLEVSCRCVCFWFNDFSSQDHRLMCTSSHTLAGAVPLRARSESFFFFAPPLSLRCATTTDMAWEPAATSSRGTSPGDKLVCPQTRRATKPWTATTWCSFRYIRCHWLQLSSTPAP